MNASFGHNETAVRLGMLANDAQASLERVARGEKDAIEGWISYGAALNEGRTIFGEDDDYNFGKWKISNVYDNLSERFPRPNEHEEVSAMWAARWPEQFEEARAAGNARTVRGIHAKWKEIEAAHEAEAKALEAEEKRKEAEEKAAAEAEAKKAAADAEEAAKAAEGDEDKRLAAELAEEARKAAEEAEEARKAAEAEANKADNDAKAALQKSAIGKLMSGEIKVPRTKAEWKSTPDSEFVAGLGSALSALLSLDFERAPAVGDQHKNWKESVSRDCRDAVKNLQAVLHYLEKEK